MDESADIVVIGAGIHGASAAWHLAREGAGRVVLVDKTGIAGGPTAKSGAMIRPLFSHSPYVQLVNESLDMFENWEELVGGDAGYIGHGFLRITTSLETAEIGGDLELMRELGVSYEILPSEDLAQVVSHSRVSANERGLWIPRAGYADPVRTTRSVVAAAQRQGVELQVGVSVTGIETNADRIEAVRTSAGRIRTHTVLNCAGPWAPRLAAMVGTILPIETHRTPTCLFLRPPTLPPGSPILSDGTHRVYMREVGDTHIRAAHFGWTSDQVDPDLYDETIRPDQLDEIRTAVRDRWRPRQQDVFAGGFSAVYDMTPDGHPIIGRVGSVDGFWCNCGWSGNGFASGPAAGRHLASQILNQNSDVNLDMFNWPRQARTEARPDFAWVNR